MKHSIIAVLAVLMVLPKEQLLGSPPGCPRRYLRRINGKCYYFSVKKMNWFGALNNCLRKGLTLADLNNSPDFYGVIGFLSSKGNTEDFWFGGNDLQHEGRFQYVSNGRLVRYYSNYSLVEPADHSECDDCLEVRIRQNITVVADDNCLERQYFICSERYCELDEEPGKPRHHSHEHLHHFHHDIGGGSEEEAEEEAPKLRGISVENAASDSEQEAGGEFLPQPLVAQPGPEIVKAEQEQQVTARTKSADEEVEGEGAMSQETTESGSAEKSVEGEEALEGATATEGEGSTPADSEGSTPAEGEGFKLAEGEGVTKAEGESGTPAKGEAAAPAEGEAATPVEGGGATPAEGATPVEGGGATPAEGATPGEGGGATPVEGGGATPPEGATPVEGGGATPPEGATPGEGGGATPVEGGGATPPEGATAAAGQGATPGEGATSTTTESGAHIRRMLDEDTTAPPVASSSVARVVESVAPVESTTVLPAEETRATKPTEDVDGAPF